jgi:serine/threonine-protein kinase
MARLDAERWTRLQSLFHAAVDLDPDAWKPYLDREAADDPSLAARVEQMLEADRQDRSFLDRSAPDVAADVLAPGSAIGRRVGPYRITRLLGEGGMGTVFLAQRDDLGTVAAVKFLRDAWLSPSRRARFAAEQRTLATLQHPGIARLLDAGVLDDGTPWIVMEYVDGDPIVQACREQGLGLRARLHLFRDACAAVMHAHQHLVVHRDVKPSNILVDAQGTVKLLDFGIAKQLEAIGHDGERTLTGLRLMTPAYAAPEQVRGEPVGVYTDVYALGVVLYELLSGRLPFDVSGTTPGSMDWSMLEREPDRVSIAARRDGAPRVAATPSEWQDLDVLCQRAMQKAPERRYASVDALVRDIDHFLRGEPLDARPDSVGYRLGKFVRRNSRGVALATAVTVGIFGLTAFYAIRLDRARDAAVAEAERTGRVQRFVTALFEGGDAAAGPADSLRVVTLVDRGAAEARSLTSEPFVQAELFQTLGGIYQKLGKLDQADSLLQAALQGMAVARGTNSVEQASALLDLGLLRADQARYDEADSLSRAALELAARMLPESHPQVAQATEARGRILSEKGDYPAAIDVLTDAVRLRALRGTGTAEYASSVYELANARFYAGHHDASDSLNRVVLAVHRQLYGERHPSVSDDLINLGAVQFEKANYTEAERYYREALDITVGHFGRDHFKTAANLTMVGRALVYQRRHDEAVTVLTEALGVRERVYGPAHPSVASTVNELGTIALQRERYDEAARAYQRMIDIYRTVYRDRHYLIGIAQSNLASVYMARGDNAAAERMFRRAIDMYRLTLPAGHSNIGIAQVKLGRSLLRQGRFAEAARESLAGYENLTPQMNPTVSWLTSARSDLAVAYDSLGQQADAARIRAESAALAQQAKVDVKGR